MALDTLPDEDQNDTEPSLGASQAEDQFAQDKEPGGGDSGFGAGLKKSASKAAAGKTQSGFKGMVKKYKIIALIIGALGALTPFILFFLFLFLFKLNHIKQLFTDYRFAKFDRVVAEHMRDAIDASKKIDASEPGAPPVAEDAPLEVQLAQAKADGLPSDFTSTEAADLKLKINSYMESDLSGAPGAKTDDEFGVKDRSITEIDPNKTEVEKKAAVDEDLRNRVDDPAMETDIPKSLEDDAKKAKEDVNKGIPPEEAGANASRGTASKLANGATDVLGTAAKATVVCILIDIWNGALKKGIIAYKAGGLVRAASTVYSWADGQKQGKADLTGIGEVAGKFDNANESFINSAGAQQAAGQPITGPTLPDSAKPTSQPAVGGTIGAIIDKFANIPGVPIACRALLNPKVQIGIAAGSVVALLVAIANPEVSVPYAAVAASIGAGLAAYFAGPAGIALATHLAISLGHAGISPDAGPMAMGNYLSGGTKIRADSDCFNLGCTQLNAAQSSLLNSTIRKEQIAAAKKKGLAYRFIATSNPRSVLSQTLFALPSSPSALLGRMDQFFASIFNPAKLAIASGNLAIATANNNLAYADDPIDPVTGLWTVGKAPNAQHFDTLENARYVKANLSKFKNQYDKCFTQSSADYAQRIIDGPNKSKCDNIAGDIDAQRYYQYKGEITTIRAAMLLKNKNPIPTDKGGGPSGAPAGATIDLSTVFQPSDTIPCGPGTEDVGPQTGYHDGAPVAIRLCRLPTLRSTSEESTPGSQYYVNGANVFALVNTRASAAFAALVAAAEAANLPLGATSTFRTMAHQQALFNDNPNPAAVASPGHSNHQMGVAIDFSCNGNLLSGGDPCFSWLSQNAGTYGIKNYPAEAWHWSVTGN